MSGTPPSKDAPVLTHARECRRQARPWCGDRELPGAQRAAPVAAAAAPSLRARLRERVLTEPATRTGAGCGSAPAGRPGTGHEHMRASRPVDTWPSPEPRARPAPAEVPAAAAAELQRLAAAGSLLSGAP